VHIGRTRQRSHSAKTLYRQRCGGIGVLRRGEQVVARRQAGQQIAAEAIARTGRVHCRHAVARTVLRVASAAGLTRAPSAPSFSTT